MSTEEPAAGGERTDSRAAAVLVALIRFVATFSGSLLVSVAAAMLVIRWRDVTTSWGAAAAGLTLFAGLPLVAAGLLALIGGSRSLRAAAVLIGVIYLVTVSPVNAIVGCGGHRTDDDLSVLTANILRSVAEPEGLAETIAASDADIVILQEVTEPIYRSLQSNELLADYRYWSPLAGAVNFEPRSSVVVVISKLEAVSTERLDVGIAGAADVIFALPTDDADDPPRTFTVTGVHLNAPSRQHHVEPWREQLATLAKQETGRPGIMAGDFNATEDHRPFRRLLDQGWVDVHNQKGCGFGLTFPVDDLLPIPVMRLDHVLVTDHFEVLGVELVEETNRSDHRPVLAHLRLKDTAG
ncbi:MAG: endonuclease/exonuclease/phosphatase family protein [Actinomycetota bacterium]